MRNLDVCPGRSQSFDLLRQDANCLGVEIIEIVAAPIIEEAGTPASVERTLPQAVFDLTDRVGYWWAQVRKSPRPSAALFDRTTVTER